MDQLAALIAQLLRDGSEHRARAVAEEVRELLERFPA